MKSLLKLRLITFFAIASQIIIACDGGIRSQTIQEPPQSGETTAAFTAEGYRLGVTTRCKLAAQKCSFRAEISAASALFELIEQVEYSLVSEPTKAPARITDAATRFRFEAEQTAGAKVYADVKLRSRDGAQPKIVRIEGTIPFPKEVTPPLPAGLRFEINYLPWYLEGVPHEPVEYVFKINLLGEASALKQIKSVEYRTAGDEGAQITHRVAGGFYLEGSMLANKESARIIAVIRRKNGERSTHTILLRPR